MKDYADVEEHRFVTAKPAPGVACHPSHRSGVANSCILLHDLPEDVQAPLTKALMAAGARMISCCSGGADGLGLPDMFDCVIAQTGTDPQAVLGPLRAIFPGARLVALVPAACVEAALHMAEPADVILSSADPAGLLAERITAALQPSAAVPQEPAAERLHLVCVRADPVEAIAERLALSVPDSSLKKVRNLESLFRHAWAATEPNTILLVPVARAGGLGRIFDRLRRLRDKCPSMVIILLVEAPAQDDLDNTRLAICDASARVPLGLGHFREVIGTALANNLCWQARQRAI